MNLEEQLINETNRNRKELHKRALNNSSKDRFIQLPLVLKMPSGKSEDDRDVFYDMPYSIVYDRQIEKFIKIIYYTRSYGITKANEILLG
jgi:hypothetical protein